MFGPPAGRHPIIHHLITGAQRGEERAAPHTFQSHHHCQKVLKWEGLSEQQLVFIGGAQQLPAAAAGLGIVCVVRCSSQSGSGSQSKLSLMPQEIPAIGHPYKVTFSAPPSFRGKAIRLGATLSAHSVRPTVG